MSWSGRHLSGNWDVIWHYTGIHVRLTLIALAIGAVAAFALAIYCHRTPRAYGVVLASTNVAYTVPSLPLFILIGSLLGVLLSDWPLIIGLAIYTLAILVRNIVEGLRSVPEHVRLAADAMGYRPFRRLVSVELPLAVPAIIAGLRLASVSTISILTVGMIIGKGGLGILFNDGFKRNITVEIWAGVIAVMVLALVFDVTLSVIGRVLTPWSRLRARA
jgi:osmoprotectant transport system permease protein